MNNDLISRSALLKEISTKTMMYDGSCIKKGIGVLLDKWEVLDRIQAAHAVDAEPVRRGQYDKGGDCTVCGYPMPTDDRCDAIFPQEIKYCYNCGAKMDLEVQDD